MLEKQGEKMVWKMQSKEVPGPGEDHVRGCCKETLLQHHIPIQVGK